MKGKLVKWRADKEHGIIQSEQKELILIQKRGFASPAPNIEKGMDLLFSVQEINGQKYATNARLAPPTLSLHPDDVFSAREGVEGEILRWDDKKGFGFLGVSSCDSDVFFHISSFAYERQRPQIGEKVAFLAEKNGERWQATRVVRIADRQQLLTDSILDAGVFSPQWGKVLLSLGVMGGWFFFLLKMALPFAFLAVGTSLFSFLLYWWDKYTALQQKWRIPEKTLHFWDLLGGWCGGLIARYLFRHKTKKWAFIIPFWLTVFLNIGGLVYLIYFQPQLLQKINHLFGHWLRGLTFFS